MERNRVLDLSKGIAISLVVIGHCYSAENYILQLIYAFHMPFFFIVSGMLYAGKWTESVQFNFKRHLKRLLIPYFIFEMLFAVLLAVLNRTESFWHNMNAYITGSVLIGSGLNATWYLMCILIVLILFVSILKYVSDKKLQIICIALAGIAGLYIPVHGLLIPLWRSMVGLLFFAVGFYGNKLFMRPITVAALFPLTGLYMSLAYANGRVSIASMLYGNELLYVVNGVLGTYLLIQVAIKLNRKREYAVLEFFGKNSIILLCTHMPMIEIIRWVNYKMFDNILLKLGWMEGILFGAIILLIQCFVVPFCNRYLKFMFGK